MYSLDALRSRTSGPCRADDQVKIPAFQLPRGAGSRPGCLLLLRRASPPESSCTCLQTFVVALKNERFTENLDRNMICVLPQETVDEIIDHLNDDRRSLGACSLTCRTWVPSSQTHIFHIVYLALTRGERFTRLLDASPHIAKYVKVLDIQEGRARSNVEPKFVEDTIPLIEKLTSLEELRVTMVNFYELNAIAQSAFIQNFSSIRSLTLHCSKFGTFREFTMFLVAHPYIENLELQCSGWEEYTEGSAETYEADHGTPGFFLPLRSISLTFPTSTTNFLNWLVSLYPILHITTICLPNLTSQDIPAVSRLFRSLGPSTVGRDCT
jgi:hypothetical protein